MTQAVGRLTQTMEAERVKPKGLMRLRGMLILFLLRLAFAAIILLAWEWAAGRVMDVFWISSPSRVAVHFAKIVASGQLLDDLYVTLYETLIGFVVGAITGVATGLILSRMETVARVFNPFIMAVYGVPRIALAPLFIIWFGIGPLSKIVMSGTVVFFLAFFNTFSGVRSVDPELLQMIRVMGAKERDVMRKIILPAASPWIIAGLKMSVPYALVGAIVGEFMAASRGLGFRIMFDSALFNTTGTMTGIIVLAILVMIGNEILDRFEGFILRWRPPEHAGEQPEMF